MKRKIIFSITSLFLLSTAFLSSPRPSYAGVNLWKLISGKDQDISSFVGEAIPMAIMSGVTSTLTGCTMEEVTETEKVGDKQVSKCASKLKDPLPGSPSSYLPGGAFGYFALAMDELKNPGEVIPLNLAMYSQDLAKDLPFNLVEQPKAYAGFSPDTFVENGVSEVTGFFFKNTILQIWKTSRNFAYSIIILLLVVVGFMIMFRRKINPQLTVTVTNSIPKLVIGLILITFSYPIAALTIPMTVALSSMSTSFLAAALGDAAQEANQAGVLSVVVGSFSNSIALLAGNLFTAVIVVVALLAACFALFSVFFTLIQRYIKIIVATIAGPLILAVGILPGQEKLTSDWIKGLVINTISVPAILTVFFVGLAFFIPDVTGIDAAVSLYVKWVIGIAIMLQARKVPGALASALKAPDMWVPSVGTAKKKK